MDTVNQKEGAAVKRLPLQGVRVLDISQVMAGPYCGMVLGDMGADVIKIEEPKYGDATRRSMSFKMKGSDNMGFLVMNRNKRSVTLNLKSKAGREVFLKMAAEADVIIENFRPGVMKKLGIGYDVVHKLNPRLIYASISGFGQWGPWSNRPGFDLIAQAMSGVMSVTGYPGGPPVKAGVPVSDIGSALFATIGILSAYIGRQATGEGQHIDASLFDTALAFSVWDIAEYWGTGRMPEPVGTANRMSAPYQAVRAKDAYFVLGANNKKLWELLCNEIKRPELMTDPRFLENAVRIKNREVLIEELEKTFLTKNAEEWVESLLAVGVPAGRLNSQPEAFDSAHSVARGMKMEIDHPIEGKINNIGFPIKFSETPQRVRHHPPLLGEHIDEVLGEFGLSPEEIEAFRSEGAFAADAGAGAATK